MIEPVESNPLGADGGRHRLLGMKRVQQRVLAAWGGNTECGAAPRRQSVYFSVEMRAPELPKSEGEGGSS